MKSRNELFRSIIDLYVLLYKKVSMKGNYVFTCTDNQAVMVENFIDEIGEKNIGEYFLKNYFEFQFNFLFQREKFGKGNVMLNWVIGKKAIDRWHNRNKFKFKYHILYGLKRAVYINNNKLNNEWKNSLLKINDNEEEHKARYINTNRGFAWCYANTTLYNHKSLNCAICVNMGICKNTLETEQNNLFKARGYEIK